MKNCIAFVSTLDEASNILWLNNLKTIFKNYEIILFKDLKEDEYTCINVAIVIKPDIKELIKLKNLKWVQSLSAGVEKLINERDSLRFNIVRMVDDNMSVVMSDSVLAWSFYLYKNMPLYKKQQNNSLWIEHEIKEKNEITITILGLGELGLASALKLKANDFNVKAWSRSKKTIEGISTYCGNDGLEEVLEQTDILVSLLPLTQATTMLLNKQKLNFLKKNASVINFSRAAIFDYKALAVLLDKKHLKHAVLDVFEQEPLIKDSSLWKHEDITILPHISGPTNKKTASKIAYENINEYFVNNKEPLFVDKNKGY
ncbi:MAG: glyoxylate/hydroxypyruvate reductase A [Arcobacter sp.]|nr:MAG: glyoxylate/hydroxypyruvate reductase A [Arcobacter sp.]